MDHVGDYQLGKTIGEGAFSKVKIGHHIETGSKVRNRCQYFNFFQYLLNASMCFLGCYKNH